MDSRDRAAIPAGESIEREPADFDGGSELWHRAVTTARNWRAAADAEFAADPLETLLARDDGAEFALALAALLRPDDPAVVARGLERLSHAIPPGVSRRDRLDLLFLGGFAPLMPRALAPRGRDLAARALGPLFLPLTSANVDESIEAVRSDGGIRPVVAPLQSRALGDRQADRQLARVQQLIAHDAVDAVSLSLEAIARLGAGWDHQGDVERLADRLAPVLADAAANGTQVMFEVTRFRMLELTVDVLRRVLDRRELSELDAGITLPASLPDSSVVLERLTAWAGARRARVGSGVTVRFTERGHEDEEGQEARVRGWPRASYADPAHAHAQLQRLLDWALTPERTASVRVVVASDDAYVHAYAWQLARSRGVLRAVEHEFTLGVERALANVVKRDVGGIRMRTPTVPATELHRATDHVRRTVRSVRERLRGERDFDAYAVPPETDAAGPHETHRIQTHRIQSFPWRSDTDPSVPESRDWAVAILGSRPVDRAPAHVGDDELDALIATALRAGHEWGERRGSTRATVLRSVADAIAGARADLIATAVHESGLTVHDADHEVTESIDLAEQLARCAENLHSVENARFAPPRLTVAVASRHLPIIGPAAQLLAALAAGSAVILKSAPEARNSALALIDVLRDGGVPPGLLGVVDSNEGDTARRLLTHPGVGRVLHSGSRHVASLFRSWMPEMRLLSTTGGRNSVVVTPSADIERAVDDIIVSAFHHAGQSPFAVGTVILVGDQERFVDLLTDAVASVKAGPATEPATELGPLTRPARGRVHDSLTAVLPGERWLVRPRQLDSGGRLWSAGLRDGVQPGTPQHAAERRAPVLSIVRVDTLEAAIEAQNGPGFGLVAGLHSLDAREIEVWTDRVEAGGLFVNAPVVRSLPSQQPIAGWNRAGVGGGRAEGGPNQLVPLGDWIPVDAEVSDSVALGDVGEAVAALITAAQPSMTFLEFDFVRAAAQDDEATWRASFASDRELPASGTAHSFFRYRPVPVTLRLAEGAAPALLVRVLAAATLAGAPVVVSSAIPLASELIAFFRSSDSPVAEVVIEADARWRARLLAGELATPRIRSIGDDPSVIARLLELHPAITAFAEPVTASGRVELLHFLAEQSLRLRTD